MNETTASDRDELVNRVTAVVRDADEQFESEGGSSRHWVRDHFLPGLEEAGLSLAADDRLIRGVGPLVMTTRCFRRPRSKLDSDPGPCGKCAACIAREAYDTALQQRGSQ